MSYIPVPFMSSDNLGTDLNLSQKLYDRNFSVSFRTQSKILVNNPQLIDKRPMGGASQFNIYMFGQNPLPEMSYKDGGVLGGQNYGIAQAAVNVEDQIVAHQRIGLKDMTISHLNIVPKLGQENGRNLALEIDRRILIQHALAARDQSLTKDGILIHNGGNRVTRSGGSNTVTATALATAYPLSATGAANLRSDVRQLAYNLDVARAPREGRQLVMDSYLLQVLPFDTNAAQIFSRDYIAGENNINRRILGYLEGFAILFDETRLSQGGLIPDGITSVITGNITPRPSKHVADFTPKATTGYPCVLAFTGMGTEDTAVAMGEWIPITSKLNYYDETHTWLAQSYALPGIDRVRPYSAGSIEITL